MLVRVSPPTLAKIEGLEPEYQSISLIPIEESSLTTKPVSTTDPIATRLFFIACTCLGAIGLIIVGLLLARPTAPTVPVQPSIVIVPQPAQPPQQPSSKCLAFCSQ